MTVGDLDDNRSVWWAGSYQPRPPLDREVACDVAIIGGGMAGVSTALELSARFPERRVVLLEARQLANGASGRNGGLVLNGVGVGWGEDGEAARRIFEVTRAGIDLVAARVRDHGLGDCFRRDGALDVYTDAGRAEAAHAEVERLAAAGLPLVYLDGAALARRLRVAGAAGAVLDPTAGVLDGVAYLRGLREVLLGRGVEVYEGTPVASVTEGEEVRLGTPGGTVRARAVVLATGAYTPRLGYFRRGIVPLLSHVVATAPLPPEVREAIGWAAGGFSDDLDRLAYGSVTPSGALLFGGGSNAAYTYRYGGRTAALADGERAWDAIRRRLVRYFPGAAEVPIAHRWTGAVDITLTRVCTMGVRGAHRNVYYAVGFSGHGLALANLAGQVLADLYAGDAAKWRGLPFFEQRLPYVPPEPLRWMGYHVYTAMTGRSPKRDLMRVR